MSATTRKGKAAVTPAGSGISSLWMKGDFRVNALRRGSFLEYAYVFGNWYGTLKKPVEDGLTDGRV